MKIIHCADVHADSKMGTHFSKEQAETRRNEIVNTFEKMVSYAKANKVRAIIIAGDLFDTNETHQKKLKQKIGYIISQNTDIDFLYLRGNHDENVNFLDDSCTNLKRFSKDKWTKYSYENVDIYGHEFTDKIPSGAYSELKLDPSHVNIVTLHGQIADYKPKNDAPEISLPKLKNQNIDYIALGHIHDYKKEKLDSRCSWCYSGCLEGRGFDECGDKGFVVLDINDNKVETQFVSVSERKIHEINVPLSGIMTFNDIVKAISDKLANISGNDIVQIDLTGDIPEETEIEPDSYKAVFDNQFFYIRFKDLTRTKIDFEKYEKDVSLKGEFIRLVKSQPDISDEDKVKIIMNGIKALAGRQ